MLKKDESDDSDENVNLWKKKLNKIQSTVGMDRKTIVPEPTATDPAALPKGEKISSPFLPGTRRLPP